MDNFEFGRNGEDVVSRYLQKRGWIVLPLRDIDMREQFKGPRFQGSWQELVSPDFLVIKGGKHCLIEVKTKTCWTWHRISKEWLTGVDQRCFEHYLLVANHSGAELWLAFLHMNQNPRPEDLDNDCPPACPTGLFMQNIGALAKTIHHQHGSWGHGGMVYWSPKAFHLQANKADLRRG